MAKKTIHNPGGIVYSTAADFKIEENNETTESLPVAQQELRIILDKKNRAGKIVTVVYGFKMKEDEIETLSKQLKSFCGSGGSVKDSEIIIQGDHREKVLGWLLKKGFVKAQRKAP